MENFHVSANRYFKSERPYWVVDCVLLLLLEPSLAAWAATWLSIWNTAITQTFSVTQSSRYCSSQVTSDRKETVCGTLASPYLWHLCFSTAPWSSTPATQTEDRKIKTIYLPVFVNIGCACEFYVVKVKEKCKFSWARCLHISSVFAPWFHHLSKCSTNFDNKS